MGVQAIIFDCDGTLVDSEPTLLRSLVDEAEHLHPGRVPRGAGAFTLADIEGRSMRANMGQLEQRLGVTLPPDFELRVRARMAQAFHDSLTEIPGAGAMLRQLRVPCCVASNGPRDKIELVLGLTGLLPHFAGRIHSAYEVGAFKPEPGLFLHAARAMGVAPADCAVVEDSLAGLHAGLAAGMTVYAYRPLAAVPPELASRVRVLDRLEDLLDEPWHAQAAP